MKGEKGAFGKECVKARKNEARRGRNVEPQLSLRNIEKKLRGVDFARTTRPARRNVGQIQSLAAAAHAQSDGGADHDLFRNAAARLLARRDDKAKQ